MSNVGDKYYSKNSSVTVELTKGRTSLTWFHHGRKCSRVLWISWWTLYKFPHSSGAWHLLASLQYHLKNNTIVITRFSLNIANTGLKTRNIYQINCPEATCEAVLLEPFHPRVGLWGWIQIIQIALNDVRPRRRTCQLSGHDKWDVCTHSV